MAPEDGLVISVEGECASIVSHLARQHGLHGAQARHESEWLVSRDTVEEAEKLILGRIREAAADGTLLVGPSPMLIVWLWRDLAGPDEVKEWMSQMMKLDVAVLRLAQVLPSTSYQSGGDGAKTIRSFKAETYAAFLDVEQLKSRLNDIVAANTIEGAAKIRAEFVSAEEAGKTSRF